MQEEKSENPEKNGEKEMEFGLSFLDISTGEFLTTQFTDSESFEKLLSELARMRPAECILPPACMGIRNS